MTEKRASIKPSDLEMARKIKFDFYEKYLVNNDVNYPECLAALCELSVSLAIRMRVNKGSFLGNMSNYWEKVINILEEHEGIAK